jgi:hypothetical protein
VCKLTGDGISLSSEKFDPARSNHRNITAGLAGAIGAALTGQEIFDWGKRNNVQVY